MITLQLVEDNVGVCELCKKEAELRPYGPQGENICFTCGKKDVVTSVKKCLEKQDEDRIRGVVMEAAIEWIAGKGGLDNE